jgi:hypothetical protein
MSTPMRRISPGCCARAASGHVTAAPKWLELLKQISPGITKAVVIRQPSSPGGGQLGAIQAVAEMQKQRALV